jgi:ribulose-5-phosphate 4-epimerase/fuculose-1-phosphate aldolase
MNRAWSWKADREINESAFAIHSRLHMARPDVVAAAHAHSLYGKTWSSLGRLLDPLTQDACAFYEDHSLFDDYTGVVYDNSEGDRIARRWDTGRQSFCRTTGS